MNAVAHNGGDLQKGGGGCKGGGRWSVGGCSFGFRLLVFKVCPTPVCVRGDCMSRCVSRCVCVCVVCVCVCFCVCVCVLFVVWCVCVCFSCVMFFFFFFGGSVSEGGYPPFEGFGDTSPPEGERSEGILPLSGRGTRLRGRHAYYVVPI